MELIGKNKHLECYFENDIVRLKFFGLANPELTMEITAKILAFTKTTKILGSFVDLTDMVGTFTKLNEHLIERYFPAMIAQGLKCEGVVVSKDVFTKFAADALVKKMGDFTMQTFQNKDDAYNWVVNTLEKNKFESRLS